SWSGPSSARRSVTAATRATRRSAPRSESEALAARRRLDGQGQAVRADDPIERETPPFALLGRRLARGIDPHRQTCERLAFARGDEPCVLHIETVHTVVRDDVRMHREDHVLSELGLDSLADLRMLDHR